MGSNVAGTSTFWATIYEYLDGEPVFWEGLYRKGIRRLSDRTMWLVDETVRILSRLASTDAGTKATISGAVDLTTLTFDPVVGDLNGKTLVLDGDVGASQTVTFGTGGTAPANPADVVTQILAQTSNKTAVLNSSSRLSVGSTTVGSLSTIEVVGGTAAALLGLTVGTASGSGTVADGASRVGFAAYGSFSATTVRAVLKSLIDSALPFPLTCRRAQRGTIAASDGTAWVAGAAGDVAASGSASQALELPNGASLVSVTAYIEPPTDGTMPGTRPKVTVYKFNLSTGSGLQIIEGPVTDTHATLGTYETYHGIVVTLGTEEVIDNTKYSYLVLVEGESGANATTINFYGATADYTVPAADHA